MIRVMGWNTDGTPIRGTERVIPCTPDDLARASDLGLYAECDTQKRTLDGMLVSETVEVHELAADLNSITDDDMDKMFDEAFGVKHDTAA